MSHLLSLLEEMRGRLAMYIGTPSLGRLAAFLRGFDLGVEKVGQKPDPFLPEFRDWIHRRFGSTNQSWEDTILSHTLDEAEGIKQFWVLLDLYLKEKTDFRENGGPVEGTKHQTIHSK